MVNFHANVRLERKVGAPRSFNIILMIILIRDFHLQKMAAEVELLSVSVSLSLFVVSKSCIQSPLFLMK